jgi:predicted ABC-type ATPase
MNESQIPALPPTVIVLAGPNGAGKTTAAPRLLRDALGLVEFVNADTIARGLSGFDPDLAAIEAGKTMFDRIHQLAALRHSFAFETTLASRSLAPWIAGLLQSGYAFHLVYLWLSSADLAVERVADRVRLAGHNVPEVTIRRRYERGLYNFFSLYQPMATAWRLCDNTNVESPRLIAVGTGRTIKAVLDSRLWHRIQDKYDHVD